MYGNYFQLSLNFSFNLFGNFNYSFYLCHQKQIMIKVNHRNIELKALIDKGKSVAYRKLEAKVTFLKALRAFFVVIGILNDIEGLRMYKQYNYKKGVEISSVNIIASKIKGMLLFRESEEGNRIDILELKYKMNYGKEGSNGGNN